ncbi:MAG: hypothetical protein A2Y38_11710 [Spirochaetes bacterium GWB1_59_5]|nr:MAG: hypothetical protein A2Y38_11710 [Spirochaetes bacterium GWB1_59_5]
MNTYFSIEEREERKPFFYKLKRAGVAYTFLLWKWKIQIQWHSPKQARKAALRIVEKIDTIQKEKEWHRNRIEEVRVIAEEAKELQELRKLRDEVSRKHRRGHGRRKIGSTKRRKMKLARKK